MTTSGCTYQSPIIRDIFEKGKAEGRAEGRADLIFKLLSLRYGPLPDLVRVCFLGMQEEFVDAFAERLMTAKPLEEVLDSLRRRAGARL